VIETKTVCIVGLGVIGFPTALHISKYHKVIGYDINPEKVKDASNHFFATTEWSEVPESDVYVVCVNTWYRNGKPDMSAVELVCQKISESLIRKALISIESTVLVGTTRGIYEDVFKRQHYVANCPHRLWELGTLSSEDMKSYGVNQLRILGAVNEESLKMSEDFFHSIHTPVQLVSSSEISEMSKIVENSYRYIEIAYAEELSITCKKYKLNFSEVRKACNTLKREKEGWQVQIMEARDGIGGTCLPKDIEYLNYLSNPGELLKGAIKTDEYYRKLLK
jgi:UDP-N-acetyl-D-mannosaminuronic acid dehydrogenase